ncbi:MAG: hypothetical protein MJ231_05325 [bacterium]|nr:hypothetical protein [bacterium]
MKRFNKKITISEEKLHQIVMQEVHKLFEYARPRNEIIERISSYLPQIIENWCLVHACSITNTNINQCKNHWKTELRTHLMKSATFKLKGKNDYKSRYSMITQAESKDELLSDIKQIDFIISEKFSIENINLDENIYQQILNDLINNKENIFDIIASMNKEKIIEYINNI